MYQYEERFVVHVSLENKDPVPFTFLFQFYGPDEFCQEEYIHGRKIKGKTMLTIMAPGTAERVFSIVSPDEEIWNPCVGIRKTFSRAMVRVRDKESKRQIGLAFPSFLDKIKLDYEPVPFGTEDTNG